MLCAGAAQTRGLHGVGEPSEHGGGGAGKSVSLGGGSQAPRFLTYGDTLLVK